MVCRGVARLRGATATVGDDAAGLCAVRRPASDVEVLALGGSMTSPETRRKPNGPTYLDAIVADVRPHIRGLERRTILCRAQKCKEEEVDCLKVD